jgi:catechol 2,3-dioxygenase-like lactoylglutathione lyase family enzyme
VKLLMVMSGVDHIEACVEYYRELGLVPVWWPDDEAVVLSTEVGGPAVMLLSRDPDETVLGPGGLFAIDDLDAFFHDHRNLDWLVEPVDRSIGRYAAFADRTGLPIRLVDYSRSQAAVQFIDDQNSPSR